MEPLVEGEHMGELKETEESGSRMLSALFLLDKNKCSKVL